MNYLKSLEAAWRCHKKPRAKDAPTVISTFAGCGGSSLGYSMAGFRECLAVEWNASAVKTFRANFPKVPVFAGDIAQLGVDQCIELSGMAPGELDIFDGSPPCQGFSTAGKRQLDDDRNQLFLQFVRLIEGMQPKVLVMENVSGMVKGKMKILFAEILTTLRSLGYRVKARVLNAKYFGVPQSRSRIIFIGVREDLGIEPTHPRPLGHPITTWEAVGHLGDIQDPSTNHVWIDESPDGRNTKGWGMAFKAKQGDVYSGDKRRDNWNKPASCITTASLAGPYLRSVCCHPQFTRTWSLQEIQMLGSFPTGFKFVKDGNTERDKLRSTWMQIGNCVPPLFMQAIAKHIRTDILEGISLDAQASMTA